MNNSLAHISWCSTRFMQNKILKHMLMDRFKVFSHAARAFQALLMAVKGIDRGHFYHNPRAPRNCTHSGGGYLC